VIGVSALLLAALVVSVAAARGNDNDRISHLGDEPGAASPKRATAQSLVLRSENDPLWR